MEQDHLFGSLFAGAATITIGSSVAVSSLLDDYPELGSQAVRYAVAALVLGLLLRARGQALPHLSGREMALVLALALTGLVGFNLCMLAALREAEPAAVGVVVGCVPVVLALIGPLAARRAPAPRLIAAGAIVAVGAAVVQGAGTTSGPALLYSLGALAGEAAFSLLAVPLLPRLGAFALSAYACAAASATLAVAAVSIDGGDALPAPTLSEATAVAYLALPVTVGAFIAWYTGVGRLGVERAGLFAGLIPISALLCGAVVGTGELAPLTALGAGLVGAGIVLGVAAPAAAGRSPGGTVRASSDGAR